MTRILSLLSIIVVAAGCRGGRVGPAQVVQKVDAAAVEVVAAPEPVMDAVAEPDAGVEPDVEEEPMSPEEARLRAADAAARETGILKILGGSKGGEIENVLGDGKEFSDEELRELEKALGAIEKKPPPPLHGE